MIINVNNISQILKSMKEKIVIKDSPSGNKEIVLYSNFNEYEMGFEFLFNEYRIQITACLNNYTVQLNEYEIVLAFCNKWNSELSVGSNAYIKEDEVYISSACGLEGEVSEEYIRKSIIESGIETARFFFQELDNVRFPKKKSFVEKILNF